MAGLKHWLLQLFIAFDQLLNVLVTPGSTGAWADESLSCRAYRMWRDGKPWGRFWMPIIDWLFAWQKRSPEAIGHCHWAYLRELQRYNMPPEMRATGEKT
jgi:hypothetical protein